MGKTVLVSGGGGYIGSVLTEMLLNAGHRVHVLDRFFFGQDAVATLGQSDRLKLIREDVRYAGKDVFAGVDIVMDLAGISNDPASDLAPEITEQINFGGPVRLATLAKEAGVLRYIFSSSCSIYGHGQGERLDEESAKAPVSLYARTKIQAEEQLAALNEPTFAVTFLRNATVYGLSHRMRFDLVINLMTLFAWKNRRIFVMGGGRQWRPVVHVKDVARAFMLMMDAPVDKIAGQAFNVGSNDQNYQVYRLAQMVRDVIPHTELEVVPDDPDKRTYNVSFDKIRDRLDFRVEKSPYEGIVEVKQALEQGRTEDTIKTKTVHYYQYLLVAERTLREVSYNGRIF
jgi:nucleoside-diphosphate-sugar epimerase